MESLENKVILVTGGAQGLGLAIVKVLSQDGALVIASDINQKKLKEAVDQLKNEGLKINPLELDVSDPKEVRKSLNRINKEYKALDAVINNAVVDFSESINNLTVEEWDREIKVNLYGPFLLTKFAFPIMEKHGGGHIVNIASTAVKRTWSNAVAYHSSKWGLMGLNGASHVEGRQKNIKVTAVIAGGMQTPFILDRFPDVSLDVLQKPENVAEVVRFVLLQPKDTVIPEVMVLPTKETSWP